MESLPAQRFGQRDRPLSVPTQAQVIEPIKPIQGLRMDQPRRFVFRGNATGVSARIRRPLNLVLPVQAVSSLPTIGGVSESKVGPLVWGKRKRSGQGGFRIDSDTYVKFDSATTKASGDFADQDKAL